tara:strand:+ start:4683 stop:4997 length:315 start_codon:yes stop_codon:yes gene_type:complete
VRSAGIRNKPVDRRYLSDQDKSDYNNSGEYSRAATAVKRARAYRGNMAYQRNRPPRTVERTPGTGGFGVGLGAQIARNREIGQTKQMFEELRPDLEQPMYDIYK